MEGNGRTRVAEHACTLSTGSAYLDMFDENGFDPQPSKVTATPETVIWEFEPPPGDTLAVSLDARIEPGVQWGQLGETSTSASWNRTAAAPS